MIKKMSKLLTNSALLGVLLLMFVLPISFLGFANYDEKAVVLSAQDSKENTSNSGDIKPLQGNIPQEIEEVIMTLEQDYYNKTVVQDQAIPEGTEPSTDME